ncbi:NS1 [Ambidensovirus CaaDV1]|uniref:NS1 n=1 Tax=Crassostrea ariakensis ambidensovirus 1 TaxID=2849716 RepID=A0A1W5YP62_9VIRU|nr:NS1 [Ambidensovirus CaaDV1]ARI46481.1 NS1 [Crassostrea ariakensis ambidensovirus 1]
MNDVRCGEELRVGERGRDIGRGKDTVCEFIESDSSSTATTEPGPSGISDRICEISGDSGRSTNRNRELPTWIDKSRKNLEQCYAKSFKERCNRVFRELQKSDGHLIRDIFRFQSNEEFENFLRCIQRDEHYRRGLLQLCVDGDHVHVAHDCNFSNGTCRCDWWKKAKTFESELRRDRRGSRRCYSRSRTLTDVEMLLRYYCTEGRTTLFQKIGGQVERIPHEGYTVPKERLDEVSISEAEVGLPIHGAGSEFRQRGCIFTDDEPDARPTGGEPRRKKRKLGASEKVQIRVVELCKQFPICPPEAIVKHKLWLTDEELRFKTLKDKEITSAISNWTNQLTTWSMKDYQEIYTKENCDPIFSAGYGNFDNYYYNIENSVNILDELVSFQCNDDSEQIIDFMTTLYNVVERKIPKLNCLVIHSPPSAGKNFFFDAIKDYYINCGHLSNANKYNNFAFQDAEGRRIVLWNEPNYSPEFLEPIKEILGGDSTCVNVKYMSDVPVYRTPVIVLTNNVVSFMTHPAFEDRLRVFEWQPAPYLKDYSKKPNPLAVYHLFKRYNLVD